jgi:hypothetical protein
MVNNLKNKNKNVFLGNNMYFIILQKHLYTICVVE